MSSFMCVMGVGRSGTSMTMQVIEGLGGHVNAGRQMKRGSKTNPRGFYENMATHNLNVQVLGFSGGMWHRPPRFVIWNHDHLLCGQQIASGYESSSQGRMSVWKDPRNTLTFPFWRSVLRDHSLHILGCVRSPWEVVASFQNCDGVLRKRSKRFIPVEEDSEFNEQAWSLWYYYNRRLLHYLDTGVPGAVVFHAELMSAPVETATVLCRRFGFDAGSVEKACESIRPELWRHRESRELPEEAQEVWQRLQEYSIAA